MREAVGLRLVCHLVNDSYFISSLMCCINTSSGECCAGNMGEWKQEEI